jgi:hypothetical protein
MYINITPLFNHDHLGYICQERVKQHEWHISHHDTQLTEMFNGNCFPSKLNVLGYDGDALGVNGTQVGILKQANEVSLQSLLEGKYSRALETNVRLEIFSNLSYQTTVRIKTSGRQKTMAHQNDIVWTLFDLISTTFSHF